MEAHRNPRRCTDYLMNIRTAQPSDAQGVVDLVTGILSTEFPADQAAYSADDLKALESSYLEGGSTFLVAEDGGKICGTCGVKADGSEIAILRRFFVDPATRGQGVGKQLLEASLAFCREKNFQEVIIRTSTSMTQAIRLCESLGFVEDGRWDLGDITLVRFVLRI